MKRERGQEGRRGVQPGVPLTAVLVTRCLLTAHTAHTHTLPLYRQGYRLNQLAHSPLGTLPPNFDPILASGTRTASKTNTLVHPDPKLTSSKRKPFPFSKHHRCQRGPFRTLPHFSRSARFRPNMWKLSAVSSRRG